MIPFPVRSCSLDAYSHAHMRRDFTSLQAAFLVLPLNYKTSCNILQRTLYVDVIVYICLKPSGL